MPITDERERKSWREACWSSRVRWGLWASALAVLALDHMALTASLCGPMNGHCLACFGAVAALAAALGIGGAGASLLRANPASGARA